MSKHENAKRLNKPQVNLVHLHVFMALSAMFHILLYSIVLLVSYLIKTGFLRIKMNNFLHNVFFF